MTMMNERLIRVGTETYNTFKERINIVKKLTRKFDKVKIDIEDDGIIIYEYEELAN